MPTDDHSGASRGADPPADEGSEPILEWRLVPADGEAVDTLPGRSPPRAVCLAGPSDAGKTSLVEALVPRLAEQDRVATVKSIHHDIEPDAPGSDTYRHREAGAGSVVGITPSFTFEITRGGKGERDRDAGPATPSAGTREHVALYRVLSRLWARGFDVILVEGFASAPLPTILVGDVSRTDVRGDVVGTDADDPEDLAAAIRALDPREVFTP